MRLRSDLGKGFPMNIRVLSAATAVACLSSIASADLDLAWDGMTAHESIHYSLDMSVNWDAEARPRNSFAFAGMLGFNGGALQLFCIELEQTVVHDPVPYHVGPFDAGDADLQARVSVLASLFDGYYDDIVATRNDAQAAAFAMLTWEIMTEQFTAGGGEGFGSDIVSQISLDLGAAQFGDYSTAAAAAAADMQAYLSLYPGGDASSLLRYSSDTHQDFVGVPAPGAVALLGVAGLVAGRRRRA